MWNPIADLICTIDNNWFLVQIPLNGCKWMIIVIVIKWERATNLAYCRLSGQWPMICMDTNFSSIILLIELHGCVRLKIIFFNSIFSLECMRTKIDPRTGPSSSQSICHPETIQNGPLPVREQDFRIGWESFYSFCYF